MMLTLFNLLVIAQQVAPATTPPTWLVILLAVLGSTAFTTVLSLAFNHSKTKSESEKNDAEAADVITRASSELIKNIEAHYQKSEMRMQAQIAEQSAKIDLLTAEVAKIPELQASIMDLSKGIDVLTQQLLEHDISPVYPPLAPAF